MIAIVSPARSALRDWLGAFSTNVLLLGIGIVTGIVAARTLGPSGRGRFAEIIFWGNFVAQLGAFGLPNAVTIESARDPSNIRMFSTVLLLSVVSSVVSVVFFYLAIQFGATAASGVVLAFVAFYVPANIFGLSLLSVDAGAQRFGLLNALRLIPQVVYLIGMLTLTLVGLASAVTFAWAMLVGSALVPIVRAAKAGRALFHRPDLAASRRLVADGMRFYTTSLLGIMRESGDRIVILAALNQTALGIYAVALTIAGSAVQNIAGATTVILLPKVIDTADETSRARQLATAASASMFVAVIMNGSIALLSPFLIPFLFGKSFVGAVPVAAALCVAQIARAGADILSYGLRAFEDWKAMPLTAGVSLVVFFPLAIMAASQYGPTGVAAGVAASNLTALVFVVHRTIRRTGLPLSAIVIPPKWMFSPSAVLGRLRKNN